MCHQTVRSATGPVCLLVMLSGCARGGSTEIPPHDLAVDRAELPDIRRLPLQIDANSVPDANPISACLDRLHDSLFCEGFERAIPGSAQGKSVASGASLAITSSGVYRGAGALRGRTMGKANRAYIYVKLSPSLTEGALHLRAHVNLAAGAPVSRWLIPLATSGAAGKVSLDITAGDRLKVYAGGASVPTAAVLERGRWTCLELRVQLGDPGAVQLWVDGNSVLALATPVPPALDTLNFGLHTEPSEDSQSLLMDEAVAHTRRIGCD